MELKKRPKIAIATGDPAGIGPEIVLSALADSKIKENCDFTVIGTRTLLEKTFTQLRQTRTDLCEPDSFPIIDLPTSLTQISLGQGNAASGEASYQYLETAINLTLEGTFQGIVTAPIAKSAWKAAGYNYPGQTEVLAEKSQTKQYGMIFVGKSPYTGWILRTLLATTHIPLNQVSQVLTPELMTQKLELLIRSLQTDFGIKNPQIAIASLNPHSGEQGQIGTEEIDWMNSWFLEQQKNYPQVNLKGLIPPDTMWVTPGVAWYRDFVNSKPADAYLALYHDQGLIPVKLMAFDEAVNTTIGLPFIRTSPDHGTAFDIAGKGIARNASMKAAINLCVELTEKRFNQSYSGALSY
ncbi:4-hydroxythreonine-4-phosphate dehydrogenase PdxA [Aphanothece hegewaldii CCALA 016]|uniref:4-hydroxythreonine-4-phosphate dehydrogenase n=1 Tax=Aphanothece hegewaldii CCALA 016 TaxID=2107694 RepID=A0A2T1M0J2_9CHRO|nr:4-hydroxythreonine-4-phosphate dehydrogenase PdxA [Aphanothece hegewaldii]PSF38167.1 4-hydroxythreonine-4-phosphate dehydrogenase PdxA [Aphanothece hegewaldii CCALA 016]